MLKEVGASGQISLGKKYAGQLFDMQIALDGSVMLTPVKVVPMAATQTRVQEEAAVYACLLYTSPSPRDRTRSRMPSSA